MDKLITGDVWKQVGKLIGGSRKLTAAIAYVSTVGAFSFKKGDLLICDASDRAIASGETSARTLRRYYRAGVQLYNCPNLHAKMLVGDRTVVLGSANLSRSARNVLIEASLISNRASIRSQVLTLIRSLARIAKPINGKTLTHMEKIPVKRRQGIRKSRRYAVTNPGSRYWITGVFPLERFPISEEPYVDKGEKSAKKKITNPNADISWIRFTGNSRLRRLAQEGDTVIEIWNEGGRIRVYEPLPILLRQDADRWTRFYIEEPPKAFHLGWKKFLSALKSTGIRKIKQTSIRELSPHEILLVESIWERFQTKSI